MPPGPGTLYGRLTAAWEPWLDPAVMSRLVRRGAVLVGLGLVAGIVALAVGGSRYDVDGRVLDRISSGRQDWLVTTLEAIGRLAGFTTVLVAGAALGVWDRLRTGTWRLGQLFVVAVGGALAVVGTVKLVVPRDRPDAALFDAFSSAFPSGHSARAVIVAGIVAWLLSRGRSRRGRGLVWAITAVGVALVAGSRVYAGMHWPSDVLAGLVIGAGWLWLVLRVADERDLVAHRPPAGAHDPGR